MNAKEIIELFKQENKTIGTAESLTGGMVTSALVDVAGASDVVRGGVVAYCDDIKRDVLHVPQALLDDYTAVSAPCAIMMAQNVRNVLSCDYGVATTGFAGPDGDEVGLVYIAVSSNKGTKVRECHFGGSRNAIRKMSAETALLMLYRMERMNHDGKQG